MLWRHFQTYCLSYSSADDTFPKQLTHTRGRCTARQAKTTQMPIDVHRSQVMQVAMERTQGLDLNYAGFCATTGGGEDIHPQRCTRHARVSSVACGMHTTAADSDYSATVSSRVSLA